MFSRPVDGEGLCVFCKEWVCTSQERYTLRHNGYVLHASCWEQYKSDGKQWMSPEYYTKKRMPSQYHTRKLKSPEPYIDSDPDAEFYDT